MQGNTLEHTKEVNVSDVCITDYPTKQNRNKLNCGDCNGAFYADDLTFREISRVIGEGIDNPFVCDACLAEYEELAVQN